MLRGSKAIVTGGSRGIGYAIADRLVKSGCKVVVTGRNPETLEKSAAALGAIPLVWDASDISVMQANYDKAAELLGGLDIVVNNAGIFAQRNEWSAETLLQTTENEWRSVMNTNLDAVFFSMKCAVKYMLAHGVKGNILNVTSVAGNEPVYGAYSASKIAATGLTRGWGKMFAPNGIVINGIAPGPVATEMNNWHDGDSMQNGRIPFGRFADIYEVASLAMYLLGADAEMCCGTTVVLDGAYAVR